MKNRGTADNCVDQHLIKQIESEKEYWTNVLKRIVAIVKSLSSRGLAFRGHDSQIGSLHNGNFMMAVELIAEFDPFLSLHLKKYGNPGKGKISYISYHTYEQFINIMSEKVRNTIVEEIKTAKYFSISVDSTPDISHVDQLSFIVRYVNPFGKPVERFLCFLDHIGHKAEKMAEAIFSTIEKFELNLKNLRGQSYDNASNMAGIYSGLQARIKRVSPLAQFVPCSAHSINLVGTNAARSCLNAIKFFDLLQKIFNFFSSSTYRWEVLNSKVKNLSDTRWSARDDACKSLNQNWKSIVYALENLNNDETQKSTTRCEADGILKQLLSLENAFMSIFWGDILDRFNICSKKLQSVNIDLNTVSEIYQSLVSYINDLRTDHGYEYYKKLAVEKCGIEEFSIAKKRIRKRKMFVNDDSDNDESNATNFKVTTYWVILDKILSELEKRKKSYDELIKKYQFLFCLTTITSVEVREKAKELQIIYTDDLGSSFPNECIHFRAHLKGLQIKNKSVPKSAQDILEFIKINGLIEIYPYIDIALRMLLCTPSSNCSTERSFSTLKRVKSYLRSCIEAERLNSLALLNIEAELTKNLDFNDVIEVFASQKSRKKI